MEAVYIRMALMANRANERQNMDRAEAAKDAAVGYAVILLATLCFLLSLAALTIVVRFIVGASAGA